MFVKTAIAAATLTTLATSFASAQTLPPPARTIAPSAQTLAPPVTPPAGPSVVRRHGSRAEARSAAPQIPSWVRSGFAVTYVAYSAFIQDGHYVDPIQLEATSRVTNASALAASGTTATHTVGTTLSSTYNWKCTNLGQCRGVDWQFWVDPNDPTASITGPEGERFTVAGSGRYTDPWNRTWNATLLNYQNNVSGVRFTVAFVQSTGLILYHVESYPTEYLIEYYYS